MFHHLLFHSIMNKARHSDVTFCDQEKASKLINDPFFTFIEEYTDNTFEVYS